MIDIDTAWELATSKNFNVATDFNSDDVKPESVTPHLHRALPAKKEQVQTAQTTQAE